MTWKEQYVKMIGCVDPNDLEIEAAQTIKNANLPSYLYKYRPASNFAIDNFRTDTVWLN